MVIGWGGQTSTAHPHRSAVRVGIDVSGPDLEPPVSAPERPVLRGWLHVGGVLAMAALAPALFARAPSLVSRLGVGCFVLGVGSMFALSATLHRGRWSEGARRAWRRADQVGIVCAIVGTNLAVGLVVLDPGPRVALLGALAGAAVVALFLGRLRRRSRFPRWFLTLPHLLLGWAAVALLPAMWLEGGALVTGLVVAGGLAYSLGALAYATQRPRLAPRTFGFHELFHAATLVGAGLHAAALWFALR